VYDAERYKAILALAGTMAATVNGSATVDPDLADQSPSVGGLR